MFLTSFPAGLLQRNCYLIGQPGGECVVAEQGMQPVAVLAGHGGRTTIGHERATNPYLQENQL